MDPNANVIWGARLDPSMEGCIRVMTIITGVKSANILGKENDTGRRIIPKKVQKPKSSLNIDYIV